MLHANHAAVEMNKIKRMSSIDGAVPKVCTEWLVKLLEVLFVIRYLTLDYFELFVSFLLCKVGIEISNFAELQSHESRRVL